MVFVAEKYIWLGCDPVVNLQIGRQAGGELFFRITKTDPSIQVDIQVLYLNFENEEDVGGFTFFPMEGGGFTNAPVTDLETGVNTITSDSNGEALRDAYDVRAEFGPTTFNPGAADLTGGFFPNGLTLDDLDHHNIAVVVCGQAGGPAQVLRPQGKQTDPQTFEKIVMTEDFKGLRDADDSDLIKSDDHWDARWGKLVTKGGDDGELLFEEQATDGPASFSIDARARNIDEFENSGRYEDTLRIEVKVDGGEWQLLDEFRVNDDGTALVGSETGQEIGHRMEELSYTGGVLDDAEESVQFRMVSDISAHNEKIIFDNVEIHTTEAVGGYSDGGGEPVHIDFNDLQAGDVVDTQFVGVTISGQRDGDAETSENDAMIFDSDSPTGGDRDLGYDDQGNILIVSEDNDSSDPDDEAHGGSLSFAFDEPSEVLSINVLDIEEDEGFIDLFDVDGELIDSIAIPLTGNNGQAEVDINASDV